MSPATGRSGVGERRRWLRGAKAIPCDTLNPETGAPQGIIVGAEDAASRAVKIRAARLAAQGYC